MIKDRIAKRNSRLVLAISFFGHLSFILPVWLLYSIDHLDFSPLLAVSLFMGIWILSAALEIPTGAWADRYGRKKLFIAGILLQTLYPLAYIFDINIGLFALACGFGALGHAMESGSLDPVVYSSYKLARLSKKAYNTFLSNKQILIFIGRVVSGITGAYLYSLDVAYPFYALIIAFLICGLLGLFISDSSEIVKETTNKQQILTTIQKMHASQLIVATLVIFAAGNLIADAVWTGYPVLFQADGRNAVFIGAVFSVIALLSALGAYVVRHALDRLSPAKIMQVFALSAAFNSLMLWQPNTTLRLIGVIPMAIMSGMTVVTYSSTIQHDLDNKYHSTGLSVGSLATFASYGAGSLFFAGTLQVFGDEKTRSIILGFALFVLLFVFVFSQRKKNVIKEEIPNHLDPVA